MGTGASASVMLAVGSLSHFPIDDLRWSRDDGSMRNSQAMLNRAFAVRTAVVFVHGFGGSAGGTWDEFPSRIRAMPQGAGTDLFLLDYPSTTESVQVCSDDFREFLGDVLHDPVATIINPSLPEGAPHRAPGAQYERIVIVAHSMGAVVVRRALLDMDRRRLAPQDHQRLSILMFAPAHRGSKISALVASGLGLDFLPGSTLAGAALSIFFRSLGDLQEKSQALELLLADSVAARARRAARKVPEADDDLRPFVVHARGDKVVVQDNFDEDQSLRPIAKHNHRSLCKPDKSFTRPAEEVRGLI